MVAWLGFFYMSCPAEVAPLFGGSISLDGTTFESLGRDPFAAWDAVSLMGKAQIIGVVKPPPSRDHRPSLCPQPQRQPQPPPSPQMGMFEGFSENTKPHYLSGGTPGKYTLRGARASLVARS